MRWALLGDSPSTLPLLRSILRRPAHELTALALSPKMHQTLRGEFSRVHLASGWEPLLADPRIQAVIVAEGTEETLHAARQLAAAGKSLLVSPRAGLSPTFAYELALLQNDHALCLAPMFVGRGHPGWRHVRKLLAQGALGKILHVRIDRYGAPLAPSQRAPRLPPEEVFVAFLCDCDLLRTLWGDHNQVTAVCSGDPLEGFSLVTVTLEGPAVPQVVWSVTAAADAFWRMTIVGEQGTAQVTGNPEHEPFRLKGTAIDPGQSGDLPFDWGDWLCDSFAAQVAALPGEAPASGPDQTAESIAGATWGEFVRSVELLEGVQRSLKKKRMIEIHFDPPSERGQFKTQMTAAGCSLLMLTLLATIAYLTLNPLLGGYSGFRQALVALIFLPLGLFLLLQLLYFVARPRENHPGSSG
ncbi:MAG: Gfo/Idh/MocA family protein [Planctomycetales bacterium]